MEFQIAVLAIVASSDILSSFSNNNVAMLVSNMAVVINPGPSPFKISMQTFH